MKNRWNISLNSFNGFTSSFNGNNTFKRNSRGRGGITRRGRGSRGGRGGRGRGGYPTNNGTRNTGNDNGLDNNPTLEDYNKTLPNDTHVCTGSSCKYRNCGNKGWYSADRASYN